MPSGAKLGHKQEAFIAALLASPTIAAAAEKAGISETTAYRWLKEAQIASAYRDARRHVVDHAIALIQHSTREAIETLRRNLKDDAPPAVQIAAAKFILEFARDGVELADLAARVEALEESQEARQ